MYAETDPRALRVLERALLSTGKTTRLRAVAMLARIDCSARSRWLQAAARDRDRAVREMACVVSAWVCGGDGPPWPAREDCVPNTVGGPEPASCSASDAPRGSRHDWEYVVEVWRGDGSLVGVFLATTCVEDDQHAKAIALGQAILATTSARADHFDPSEAGAFIVGKERAVRGW